MQTVEATETRSRAEPMPEKPRKRPRKGFDAPDKKECQCSEEGLQSKKESDHVDLSGSVVLHRVLH